MKVLRTLECYMLATCLNTVALSDRGVIRVDEYYPRYALVGDQSKFEFNLHIRNVELSDDASYTCQRPPSVSGLLPLLQTAAVTVLGTFTQPRLHWSPLQCPCLVCQRVSVSTSATWFLS